MVHAINTAVSRTTGLSPGEVFFGEPLKPLASDGPAAIPAPPRIGEASPEELRIYVRALKQRLAQVRQRALAEEA